MIPCGAVIGYRRNRATVGAIRYGGFGTRQKADRKGAQERARNVRKRSRGTPMTPDFSCKATAIIPRNPTRERPKVVRSRNAMRPRASKVSVDERARGLNTSNRS